MKTFTVIQAGSLMEIKADEAEYHAGGAFLMRELELVFAGPSAYTTLIDNDAVVGKEKTDAEEV